MQPMKFSLRSWRLSSAQSGIHSCRGPAGGVFDEEQTFVKTMWTAVPELNFFHRDGEAPPEFRQGYGTVLEFQFMPLKPVVKRVHGRKRLALF